MKDSVQIRRSGKISVHGMYPENYQFNWEKFNEDPEHYVFTKDDIAYWNAMELEKYEAATPMTAAEKRALRRWVASGHSLTEAPPSRYACIHSRYPEPDFLEAYRTDRELDEATKGMTREELAGYLRECSGQIPETESEREARLENERLRLETPEAVREKIRLLQREIAHVWAFIMEKGLQKEADTYVKAHMDQPAPFEDEW